ncbi:MAG: hypothetical protein MJ236_05120 [Clostridia bacterium]|nr:hypothetical protein [Clostridia bacterium]
MKNDVMDYYQELNVAYDSKKVSICFNPDKIHNAIVMQFILDHCSEVKMYCKHMSVFRKHFYDNIEDVDSKKLKESVEHSLDAFLNKPETKLTVITVEGGEYDDFLCGEKMKCSISNGKVNIHPLANDFAPKEIINHFTIADNSILRFENDIVNHGALCSFHNQTMIKNFNSYFKTLLSYATI